MISQLMIFLTKCLTKRTIRVIALIDTIIFFLLMNWIFNFDYKLLMLSLSSFIGGALIITLKDTLEDKVEINRTLNDIKENDNAC